MSELREIVTMIEQSKIDVLHLEKAEFKLYYQKEGAKGLVLNDEEIILDKGSTDKDVKVKSTAETAHQYHEITSPMIGAFYSRPSPDAEPFVQVGSKVSKNDPVCVLEAMKLLNEVRSDVTGEIMEVLIDDGQIIEYGQPLFTVKVSD